MNKTDYKFFRILSISILSKLSGLLFGILTVLSLFSYLLTLNIWYLYETITWFVYMLVIAYCTTKNKKTLDKISGKIR